MFALSNTQIARSSGSHPRFRVSIFYLDEIRRKLKSRKTRVARRESVLTKRGYVGRSPTRVFNWTLPSPPLSSLQRAKRDRTVKHTSYFPSLRSDNRNQPLRRANSRRNVTFARLFAHCSNSVTDRHGPKLGWKIRFDAFYENIPLSRFPVVIKRTALWYTYYNMNV